MAGGIAGHYRIWFDISGYDASACDNGTISDGYAGENRAAGAQPDVITDLYIASCAIVILYAGSFFDERWEGKRADPICAMKSPKKICTLPAIEQYRPMRRVDPSRQS